MDWLELKDKVFIVTGGSSGIGKAVVERLLELGAKVTNADLREGDTHDDNLLFVTTDISQRQAVEYAVSETLSRFGKIDGVVNNAGINIPSLLVDKKEAFSQYEMNDTAFEKIFSINQKGLYLMSQAVGRELVKQGHGVIVNMSSESGLEGSEGQSAYAATKAAVNSYTRSWAKELGKQGIRVVGVAPGIMEETGLRTIAYETALAYTRDITVDDLRAGYSKTSTIPLGRSGRLGEVADAVAYFLSDKSSYISGVTLNIAGGKTRG